MNKITIGIDPSINSTGVCVHFPNGNNKYYIISSKMTKKMKDFNHKYVEYFPYEKLDTKDGDYSDKEKPVPMASRLVALREYVVIV